VPPAAAPVRPAGDQVAPPPPDEVAAAEPNIIDDLDLINQDFAVVAADALPERPEIQGQREAAAPV
jgi:hypothetical protein